MNLNRQITRGLIMSIITNRQDSHRHVNPAGAKISKYKSKVTDTFPNIRGIQVKNSKVDRERCPDDLKKCCYCNPKCAECFFSDWLLSGGGNSNG